MAKSVRKLLILGAGSFAEEVAEIAMEAGLEVVAFVEGIDRSRCGVTIAGCPVVWIGDIDRFVGACEAICAVGSTKRTEFIACAEGAGMRFTSVAHPSAQVATSSALAAGAMVSAGVVVAAQCHIGRHVILNRGCLVGHHVTIGDFATLSPGVNIAGRATVGAGAYLGMGAVVLDKIRIGSNALVGAGAVVTRDVPDGVQVLGVPARVVKHSA